MNEMKSFAWIFFRVTGHYPGKRNPASRDDGGVKKGSFQR